MKTQTSLPVVLAVVALAAGPHARASEAHRAQAETNFLEADADADGALTFDEFTTMVDLNAQHGIGRAAIIQRLGRYGMAFGRLDGNGDGLVTPEELRAMAEARQR
ncbi:MAG: hypothetical protein AAF830_11800 [Pseudomonadota bacterium]